jgi:hypothetical protein
MLQINPIMYSDWFKADMDMSLCFRSAFPSIRHTAQHTAMLKDETAAAAVAAAAVASADREDTAGTSNSAAKEKTSSTSSGYAIDADTWAVCTKALEAVGCQVVRGEGTALLVNYARSELMLRFKCRESEREHIRPDGCPCHCAHCGRCNLAHCVCYVKSGHACTDVLCTCNSTTCHVKPSAQQGTTSASSDSSAIKGSSSSTHSAHRTMQAQQPDTRYMFHTYICSMYYTSVHMQYAMISYIVTASRRYLHARCQLHDKR